MTLPGYVLNAEGNDFYYISISRLRASVGGPSPSGTVASTMTGGRCESSNRTEDCLPCSTPPQEAHGPWAWPASESRTGLETGELLGMGNLTHSEVGY